MCCLPRSCDWRDRPRRWYLDWVLLRVLHVCLRNLVLQHRRHFEDYSLHVVSHRSVLVRHALLQLLEHSAHATPWFAGAARMSPFAVVVLGRHADQTLVEAPLLAVVHVVVVRGAPTVCAVHRGMHVLALRYDLLSGNSTTRAALSGVVPVGT